MTIKQLFEKYIKEATSAFLATEKKNDFPAVNIFTHNRGNIRSGTPLQFTTTRGDRETPSYQLAQGAKPSDVITGLISGKYSCTMTCQMVRQLCWYHALLSTLTDDEALGKTKGTALFNQLLTEVFPFVLRDFEIIAGTPFISAPIYSCARGIGEKVILHPLSIFRTQNLSAADDFMIGDALIFKNFDDYLQVAAQARQTNPSKANSSSRRIAALYLGNNEANEPIYYAFETKSNTNTAAHIAEHLTKEFNSNLALLKSTERRESNKLLNSEGFYERQMHERFNVDILSFLIKDSENALNQVNELREVLMNQAAKVNGISGTSSTEVLGKMQVTFNAKGVAFYKEEKYAQAAEAFTLAAANAVRCFEANMAVDPRIIGRDLAKLYYNLARSYEHLGKHLLARHYFETAVNCSVCIHEAVAPNALEGLTRMNKLLAPTPTAQTATLTK